MGHLRLDRMDVQPTNLPDWAMSSMREGAADRDTVASGLHFVGECNRYRDLISGFDQKLIY
jgi:hypothetical protein